MQIYDLDTLLAEVRKGLSPKYLFFWGHQPRPDGQIGKSCFSQWWESSFEVDGILYHTAEHYMMAEKARLFEDEENHQKILNASHPGEAKKLGRLVQGFQQDIWVSHRFDIVVQGNIAKFSQNNDLREFLLGTKKQILVEASPRDRIWGIGLDENSKQATNPEKWKGLNLLGFALMKVRDQLSQ